MMSDKRPNIHGIIGVGVLIVAEIMMFKRVDPFVTWFYALAWWSYILIVDSLIYRLKGDSLVLGRTREFFLLICWSFSLWFFFEMVNLAMKNWYYINVPNHVWVRVFGYGISYGTVLPAIFETTELLETLGVFRSVQAPRFRMSAGWSVAFFVMGGVFLILPLFVPRYTFPLIWGSFIFLLEPINYRFGGRSLLAEWERGSLRKFYLLLLAGFICGALWEFWNFWARTKWVYTVPFFDELKLFEMPVLGFLGFPPFAVECYIIYNFISLFRYGRGWEPEAYRRHVEKRTSRWLKLVTALGILFFYIIATQAIDRFTIHSTLALVDDLPYLTKEEMRDLKHLGIRTAHDLVWETRNSEGYNQTLAGLKLAPHRLIGLVRQARLMDLKGLGIDQFLLLEQAGIDSVAMLARQDPETLQKKLASLNVSSATIRIPPPAEVRIWIREARQRASR